MFSSNTFNIYTRPSAPNTTTQDTPLISPTTPINRPRTSRKRKAEPSSSTNANDRTPLKNLDGNRPSKKLKPSNSSENEADTTAEEVMEDVRPSAKHPKGTLVQRLNARTRRKTVPNGTPNTIATSSDNATNQVSDATDPSAIIFTFKRGKKFLLPGSNGGPKGYSSWDKKTNAKGLQVAIEKRGFLDRFLGGRNPNQISKREMINALLAWDMDTLTSELKVELESRGYTF
ncbi:hypothetical protein BU16DRAFT_556420 [Lophium mytilinum]|uniref:Uncharacterized protein n=1 Tax=Lophium mytilinum TaxID=390894 RepID=A0A6A6R7U7_9PEZI|nr:hypothetical protein BU16DRAFT_556420 [Lophium mytilinum]